jgi:hypothetical protein
MMASTRVMPIESKGKGVGYGVGIGKRVGGEGRFTTFTENSRRGKLMGGDV